MKNKKKFINILLIVLVSTIIVAVTSVILIELRNEERNKNKNNNSNTNTDIKEKQTYTPPLYKICDDNSCVYLLGTMHIGDNNINNFNTQVLDIYNSVDKLAVEIDITDEEINQSKYLIEGGATIEDFVSEEFINKLKKFGNEHPQFMYEVMKYYKLGFIETYLTSLMYMDANFINEGVDTYFLNLAHSDNKEIISLETMEEQEKLMFDYSNDFYINEIESIIDNYDFNKASLKLLYTAYINGDIDLLKTSFAFDSNTYDEEYLKYIDDVYTKRNEKMTNSIKEFLKNDDNVLIAVGAAHVIAEDGIIDRLESNYTIERIK